MRRSLSFFVRLFTSTFMISAFTFGGGFVIVPLLRKRFVEQYHWIDEQEMLDLTAIAQSAPGPIAVNAAVLVGFRLAGMAGALTAALGTVLPPFLMLSLLSVAYTQVRDSLLVRYLLRGMQAGVAAVIADVVISMARGTIKADGWRALLVMIGAFTAVAVFRVNVMWILLACALLGIVTALWATRGERKGART